MKIHLRLVKTPVEQFVLKADMPKLICIKIVHTVIWLFFNVVLFYLAYAVIINKIDMMVWVGIALILVEVTVLSVFKRKCPLTILARKYSRSTKHNFDIYLPDWLAKNNKLIYAGFFTLIIGGIFYRTLTQLP